MNFRQVVLVNKTSVAGLRYAKFSGAALNRCAELRTRRGFGLSLFRAGSEDLYWSKESRRYELGIGFVELG